MSSSFGEEDVTIRFVVPRTKGSEDCCSEDLKRAFQVCLDHNFVPTWISEEDCIKLQLSGTDVVVFEEFSGEAFHHTKTFTCLIIGPRCILDCLAADILIPKSKHPLYTVAMRGLIITSTGFSEPLKSQIIEKIQSMGGTYSGEYRLSVTHLVAYQLGSAKYEKALESGVPVMSERWVENVWKESCKRNVHASDEEFLSFTCPVFHHMVVTCSQLARKQKEQIKSLINKHGGEFHGELEAGRTKVLVVTKPFGEKFKHAQLWRIPCVSPAWVMESIAHGHALPTQPFSLLQSDGKTSTPERSNAAAALNFSTSMIQPQSLMVDETVNCTPVSTVSARPIESPKKDKYVSMIKKINMNEVKRAGSFLDGCNVYLSGFDLENFEKLRKIINSGGATRFNEISESVTHVIVGDFIASDVKILKEQGGIRHHVVTVEWLMESIKMCCPAPETPYCCLQDLPSPVDFTSPLSKKGLLTLHSQGGKHVRALKMVSPMKTKSLILPQSIVDQYAPAGDNLNDSTHMETSLTEQENTVKELEAPQMQPLQEQSTQVEVNAEKCDEQSQSSGVASESSQADFFTGFTFSLAGYNSVITQELETLITSAGGRVVTKRFKGIPDYGVVPLRGASLYHTTTEVVTHHWLDDCVEERCVVPIRYYHQPTNFVLDSKPLSTCVVTATLYNGSELRYISDILQGLGAVHQAMMARVDRPGDGIQATTHLLAPKNATDLQNSRKYKAACKWDVPCVTHEWVLACARENRRVPEDVYLVNPDILDVSVVEHTPRQPAIKRKLGQDTAISKFEVPNESPGTSRLQTPVVNSTTGITPLRARNTPLEKIRTPTNAGGSGSNSTPDSPWVTPRGPHDVTTPDTPYGQVFVDNPSPRTRKMWKRWIDTWPEEPPHPAMHFSPPKRRNSTPVAELKRRLWQKFAIEPYEKTFGHHVDGTPLTPKGSLSRVTVAVEQRKIEGLQQVEPESQVEQVDSPPPVQKAPNVDDSSLCRTASPAENVSSCRELDAVDTATAAVHTERTPDTQPLTPFRGSAHVQKVSSRLVAAAASVTAAVAAHCGGINTQLRELDHIIDSVSKSSARSTRGSNSRGGSSTGSRGFSDGTAETPPGDRVASDAPPRRLETIDVGSELVEWVDPAISNQQKQKQIPVFMLTSIDNREHYEEIIRDLDGILSSALLFDHTVSHIVCEQPSRNEKILSSIAAGKWVLEKKFLDESKQVGHFLDEEDYEWGNPRASYTANLVKPGSIGEQLAQAIYRWRVTVQRTGKGAFAGMHAIVCAAKDKADLYKRLILAGGGEVLSTSPPFSDPDNATVCIIELNKVQHPVDLRSLAEKRVPCVQPIYLNNFLIKDPPPDVNDCVIPEYKEILDALMRT